MIRADLRHQPDRGRTAAQLLLEVAGPQMYRRNPFRITGLATSATAREVRRRRSAVLDGLAIGVTGGFADPRMPLPEPLAAAEVRAAFDTLASPDRRLVHELFWWWGEPGECGCAAEVHEVHDRAVEAHARALDRTLAGGGTGHRERFDLWADAADPWEDALDGDGFWEHVRYRVAALADRRLDESTVAGLRRAMPRALVAPQAALARSSPAHAGLATLLDLWEVPAEVIDDARTYAAEPTCERIDTLLDEIADLLDDGRGEEAATRAHHELWTAAALLETLVPHERYRHSARLRNQVAIAMNNSALELGRGPSTRTRRRELLEGALDLAVTETDSATIAENLAAEELAGPAAVNQSSPRSHEQLRWSPVWPGLVVLLVSGYLVFGLGSGPVWKKLVVMALVLLLLTSVWIEAEDNPAFGRHPGLHVLAMALALALAVFAAASRRAPSLWVLMGAYVGLWTTMRFGAWVADALFAGKDRR